MAKGIIGKKIGMTQVWSDAGVLMPVTAVKVGPIAVVQVKNEEKDGYSSIKFGYSEKLTYDKYKEFEDKAGGNRKISKPVFGQQKESSKKCGLIFNKFYEVKNYFEDKVVGDSVDVDVYKAGDRVFVRGVSKGKGFQGVVKRYNFGGGRKTHGSTFHRSTGSIGACASPGEVIKGQKMPGRMGGKKVTSKNVEVVRVDSDDNLILIKGALPGANGSALYIYQH